MKKTLAILLATLMVLSVCSVAVADETAIDTAYIMYADAAWANQYWSGDAPEGITANNADITGPGSYTVGLEFSTPAEGLAFAALGIVNGENTCAGYYINITAIRVNGEAIEVKKGYTSSDDGVTTRMNIYNEWVAEVPADARSFDGTTADASPIIVDKDAFASVSSVEVDFTYGRDTVDQAYIMFASADWSVSNWGVESAEGVTVTAPVVTGAGDYTTALEFAAPVDGVAFTAVGIVNGELTNPKATIQINEIRINGEAVEIMHPGYTSSDDGICTRMNIFNEWVSALPDDARVTTGDVTESSWIMVDPTVFTGVTSYEVDFTLTPVNDLAYIMYADSSWTQQNWGTESAEGMTVVAPVITGEGNYTTSITFDTPAEGCAFTALGIVNGENTFPGYFIKINSIKVNGEEIEFAKGYTSTDDKVCTRMNIFNEWVAEVPAEARSYDGVTEDAAAIIVDVAALASVSSIEVNFDYIYGVPAVVDEAAPMTAEEAKEALNNEYNAYIAFQGATTYVFRNSWNDSYGKNDTEHPFFYQVTGWEDTYNWAVSKGLNAEMLEDNSVNMGGEFTDAVINGNGTYTVSVTTGELGFGDTAAFNMLYVSTDIPAKLVADGFLTVSDVTVKVGDSKTLTMEHDYCDVSGDYLLIKLLDNYNFSSEPFGYTVPGANSSIVITFTLTANVD